MEFAGISVYSLASAILFFNVGLLLICFFRRNTAFLTKNSTVSLAVLSLLSLIRIFLPLDLNSAAVLSSEKILPSVIDMMAMPIGGQLTAWRLLLILWAAGFAVVLGRFGCSLWKEIRAMKHYRCIENPRIQKIASECLSGSPSVFVSPDVDVPKATGLRTAYIYLPPLQLTDEEVRLILLHEFQHVKGGDLWIKLLYLFLKAVFWWNPIVHLFYREVEKVLELRCDAAVTASMTEKERVQYVEAILTVIKQASFCRAKNLRYEAALVNLKAKTFIEQRFHVLLDRPVSYSKVRMIRNLGIMMIAFVCSYFVIIQPAYYPPEEDLKGCIRVTRENACIMKDKAGNLELYVDGEPFGRIEEEELEVPPCDGLEVREKKGGEHE